MEAEKTPNNQVYHSNNYRRSYPDKGILVMASAADLEKQKHKGNLLEISDTQEIFLLSGRTTTAIDAAAPLKKQKNSYQNYERITPLWQVPDFGGRSLDTDPYFGRECHFCGTIIDVRTDINPYKMGTQHQPRKRRGVMFRLY